VLRPISLLPGLAVPTLSLAMHASPVAQGNPVCEVMARPESRLDVELLKRCALVSLQLHQEATALRAARAAAGTSANDAEASVILVLSQVRAGAYQEGLDGFAGLPPEMRTSYGVHRVAEAARLVIKAQRELRDGDATGEPGHFKSAALTLERAINIDTANVSTRLILGWVYLEKVRTPADAYRHLSLVARTIPGDLRAIKLFAAAAASVGRFGEAIGHYRSALAIEPGDDSTRVMLARALFSDRRVADAQREASLVLSRNPVHGPARLAMAEFVAADGHISRALRDMMWLTERDPANAGIHATIGDLHRWSGDLDAARRSYEEALWLDQSDLRARTGLAEIVALQAPQLAPRFLRVRDAFDFTTTVVDIGGRLPLWRGAFAELRLRSWSFNQGSASASRIDEAVQLEQRVRRTLNIRVTSTRLAPDSGRVTHALATAVRWTPMTRVTINASFAANDPVVETMQTALTQLSQTVMGVGADVTLTRDVSLHATLLRSALSDDNRRTSQSVNVAYHTVRPFDATVRMQFERLIFRSAATDYFSPAKFDIARPLLESTVPVTRVFSVVATLEVPFVLDQKRAGFGVSTGALLRSGHRVEVRGSVFHHHVPAARSWSAEGLRLQSTIRF
jgi:tetratricopeptide (TPR) repeat protein